MEVTAGFYAAVKPKAEDSFVKMRDVKMLIAKLKAEAAMHQLYLEFPEHGTQ